MYINNSDNKVFIIWNDGKKWNIDNRLTVPVAGTVYHGTTIVVNNIMYAYITVGKKAVMIYYDTTNSEWKLLTSDEYANETISTITIGN